MPALTLAVFSPTLCNFVLVVRQRGSRAGLRHCSFWLVGRQGVTPGTGLSGAGDECT
jgi:hypothetical protein